MKKDITFAFFKIGTFSHINDNVIQALENSLPYYKMDILDIWDDIAGRYDFINVLCTLKTYAMDIICGRKRIDQSMLRTPYLFNKVKNRISEKVAGKDYAFTFQMQSLFDTSIPGIPHFIYTDHTHLANLSYPAFSLPDLYAPSWIKLEKTIYQNASLIFTMSKNIEASLINQYGCLSDKICCVYAGHNAKGHEDEKKNENHCRNKNILFVGVDWERKGGPQLVEAFKIVKKFHPDAHLTIVGCSPSLDLPDCKIVGKVPLEAVKNYYQKASIFCLPSRLEPFGIVFLEAMSYGLPVVATNIGAIPDFIKNGENGYLVNPDDEVGLADRLIKLLDDPALCREFGVAGNNRVKDRYTWDKTGKRIRDNILRVMSSCN